MVQKAWGNECRTTIICIDSYQNEVPTGRIYNPYLKSGRQFYSLTQILIEVDKLLDERKWPQSFTAVRTFSSIQELDVGPPETERQEGLLATFAVKILFRQNTSWQGSVTWMETGQEQPFRSVLELIFLMNSALSQVNEQAS